jgi:predicted short-subunit dehydrogenase-like oxidoreductase (DUF2520 family)
MTMTDPATDFSASLAILGPGRLGSALAHAAHNARLTIAIGARDPDAAADLVHALGQADVLPLADAARTADLVLLTVSDDAIEPVCDALASEGAFRPGMIVAHCSGVHDTSLLASAKHAGCHVASCHPLQTFPVTDAAEALRLVGAYCFCEGNPQATDLLSDFARVVGAIPVVFPSKGKALYHAAAVMASNYVTTLADAAIDAATQAGIDPATAQAALGVLLTTAAENAHALGPADAITGPIARGDVGTIKKHLAALADCDENLRLLYRTAGARTVDLAVRKGTLTPDVAAELKKTLGASEHA